MKDPLPWPNKPVDWHTRTGGYAKDMLLRDYFAAHASEEDIADALSDMDRVERVLELSDGRKEIFYGLPNNARQIARYIVADAMLKAREA